VDTFPYIGSLITEDGKCHAIRNQGSCLEKEIMQGTMPGARRRGRPRTAWMDNFKTWTGLPVEESLRMTEDRDKWRKYVHGVANPGIEDGCKNRTEQLADSQTHTFSSLLRLSAHHLALTASASQPLKSGTLSLYLPVPVPVLIPSVVTSRPTTASRPSSPLNPSPLAPQIRLC